ncbi:MAG: carboxypeptidase regulatory-like domain-containing protein, partial [Desulfuromonadales bacterium]|nr:carboxypeptidase regulatory-like domain-containing protein [Desulfuromonadales bacterium]
MKTRTLVVILLLVSAFSFLPAAFAAEKDSAKEQWLEKEREKARLERIEYYANLNMPIVFYGKVVDLDGNPVPDAEVTMRLAFSPPTPMLKNRKIITTTTDLFGRFSIEATGYYLGLVEIVKDGYHYHFKYNKERGFRFKKGKKKAELGQIEDHPAIFKVRKKGKPTLVLTGHASFQLRPGAKSKWVVDLIGNRWSE